MSPLSPQLTPYFNGGHNSGRGSPACAPFPETPPCVIHQPPAAAGRREGRSRRWILEFSALEGPFSHLKLDFPDLDSAVGYAEQKGLSYQVLEPPVHRLHMPYPAHPWTGMPALPPELWR